MSAASELVGTPRCGVREFDPERETEIADAAAPHRFLWKR